MSGIEQLFGGKKPYETPAPAPSPAPTPVPVAPAPPPVAPKPAPIPSPHPAPIPLPVATQKGLKTVCAVGTTVEGIDISSYQPNVDWQQVLASGRKFVFMKAFEYLQDKSFSQHWAEAKAHGMIRGAYDFFHPSRDPIAQAQAFAAIVGKLDETDLPCVIDWESTDSLPGATDRAAGKKFLAELKRLTGKRPIIYSGPYFIQAMGDDVELAQYPLWVAHYGPRCPLVPYPWPSWTFWQYSGSGTVPGINGQCDLDVFNGSLDQLKAFIQASNIA